ncbi:MAG: ABC transporter ATP-binding protein [Candidatus Micrarchaeota archaeon]
MLAVKTENLGFSYAGKPVLVGISLEIKQGEFVGLIGKTGCGKSTFLLTLNGLIPHMVKGEFTGKVEILGKDTSEVPVHELAQKVAFVFQDPDEQIFSLSARDEVLFGLQNIGVRGEEAEKRTEEALKAVGLLDSIDSDPHTLSYGSKQKLAFACAISVDPELVVLDEPVSSLDNESSEEIYSILKGLNRKGKTIIAAEHDTEWLAEHASRLLFLNNGKIELDGELQLLFDKKIEKAGVKIPCIAKVSKEMGASFLTPRDLINHMKKRKVK